MSENGRRWDVDTINYDGWLLDATDGADFLVELVHEIRRLQTENIRLQDRIDFDCFADAMYIDGMAGVYGGE